MDAKHHVIRHGRVLVEGNEIAAVWRRHHRPPNVHTRGVITIRRDGRTLLFPGLINLHDHPNFDVLPPWPAPSSHVLPQVGKLGTDPYDQRYEWNGAGGTSPDELGRLVQNPADALESVGLGGTEVKYAEVAAMLGGETAIQGAAMDPESDGILIRNIDNNVFNHRIASPQVGPITGLRGAPLRELIQAMRRGRVDAWMVHLAEGVRDGNRRRGDGFSSRAEFQGLKQKGLLTDMTVIIHGTALERPDFAAMRSAPTIRDDGTGDGRGAKLVWSPRSNLVLYGRTTNVYQALAEHTLTSLGTDWTPSGSHTLLDELKVADRALRDPRVLGASRGLVPRFRIDGRGPAARRRAENALDRALVDMVTRNPAVTLHWYDRVGSIEKGKLADLLLLRRPRRSTRPGVPPSVYRRLIDATERDVQLVTVGGRELAGSIGLLRRLKPGDHEVIRSSTGGYQKAIDVTWPNPLVPGSGQSFDSIDHRLSVALAALGGDNPPPGGGPADATNTYSYLKAHLDRGIFARDSDTQFHDVLASLYGTDTAGRLNLESIAPTPVLGPDPLRTAINDGRVDPSTGLLADPAPPFKLYPANFNQIGPAGNPLAGLP
jgi:cytosine/adenosine deaminase-related metal-dependent hydrolase